MGHLGPAVGLQSSQRLLEIKERKVGGNVLIGLHIVPLIDIYLCDDIKT